MEELSINHILTLMFSLKLKELFIIKNKKILIISPLIIKH